MKEDIVTWVLVIILILSIFCTISLNSTINYMGVESSGIKGSVGADGGSEISDTNELEVPKIKLIKVDADCDECIDLNLLIEDVKTLGVDVQVETHDYADVLDILAKYNISRVPALVVSGEVSKDERLKAVLEENARMEKDVYVFEPSAPYVDVNSGVKNGLVSFTMVTKEDCDECVDLNNLVSQLEQSGVKFVASKYIDYSQSSDLIEKYNINRVPSVIFSSEFSEYGVDETWDTVGTKEANGEYIVRYLNVPSYDVGLGAVVGGVSMTVVNDESCDDCYDAKEFFDPLLLQFGVLIKDFKSVGIDDPIVNKYGIDKVPTVVLTGDISEYKLLSMVWENIGSIEADGAYVFRNIESTNEKFIELS